MIGNQMNIREALLESKENGSAYSRGGMWIKWYPGWEYKLSLDDLISEDWEPIGITKPTKETE